MAGITCTGCGAHVTVRGLTKCPICRIPMSPISDARVKVLAPTPSPPRERAAYATTAKDWFTIITLSAIAILIVLIIYRVAIPSDSQIRDRAVSAALYQCQRAIHLTAQYGNADMPPYVKNYGRDDEFYFAWPRGSFEFANGFGAREKMSASCNGILSTNEIKSLTVNGKDIL